MVELYDKTGKIKLGELTNCIECLVEEERNGIFEISIIYPTTDSIFNSLEEENIIVCNANDTLLNQKFRIYMTRKLMNNKIEVFARHISFDLAYDTVNNIDITNQSCEYALNTIFRQSQFSTHYKGYSDIINAQNYKISMCNCIEAIAGKEGSIIDTYGTGAEILRDNTNIYVKNRRGNDNLVSIEYAKNLTGFELEEDTTDLVTRIMPYAKYNNSETNEEIMIKGNAVDSPLINNYSHPYISYIDYSDKFEEGETPTTSKLTEFAKAEYRDNKVDIPKQNYKIEFIPLSKCVGYEGLEDKISLCDTVTIKDTRYNIDTKAKVIRTVYDVLKDRYDSMELGEPRTTLGDIIVGSGEDGAIGPQGPQGPAGNNGIDGKTTYFHIKYSNIANPTESSQITEIPSTYIGTYVDFIEKDSTDPKKYTWSRFEGLQGKNGEQGIPGTNGIDGKTTYLHIKYSNDGGKTFTSNNGETVGEWMGTYTDFNINDSRNPTDYKWVKIKGEQGIQGPVGADGKTTYTWIKYADTPSSGMSDFPEGKEYIGIAYNKTTATESNNYSDYSWSLIKGADGVQGPQGEATYTWIKYADSPTSGMSDDPTNKIYMGIAYNKTTKKESTNYSDYSWSLIRGPQGPQGEQGIPGPQGPPGQDGNMENFPNTLPSIPVLSSQLYGFSNIELSWTFESKVYYQYELYASKIKDFTPNEFDLIHAGQTSSFLFQAKPNETWYFRVCAKNTHGERTEFSSQVVVNTVKEDNLSNYFTDLAIGKAVVGSLTSDYMEAGTIKANWVEFKGMSVVNGNGKRTFDINSFGDVYIDGNINLTGLVTFESLDKSLKSQINTLESNVKSANVNATNAFDSVKNWTYGESTTIDGGKIHAGSITADKIDVKNLAVRGDLITGEIWGLDGVFYSNDSKIVAEYSKNVGHYVLSIKGEEVTMGTISHINNARLYCGVKGFSTYKIDGSLPSTWEITNNGVATFAGNTTVNGTFLANALTCKGGSKLWYVNEEGFAYFGNGATFNNTTTVNGTLSANAMQSNATTKAWYINGNGYAFFANGAEFTNTTTVNGTFLSDALTCRRGSNLWYINSSGYAFFAGGSNVASDKSLKCDIKYVNIDKQTIDEEGLVSPNVNITTKDMHNFISTLNMVSYRLVKDKENHYDRTHYGFLAQEVLHTKVGSELINTMEEDDEYLSYSVDNFIAFICGALKEEIKQREKLEQKLNEYIS